MVEEVTDSNQDETVVEGLVEGYFAFVEVRWKCWQHFVVKKQYELDLHQIDCDGPMLALETIVHRNQPSQRKLEI